MKNNFEDIICKYLDDELNHEQDYKADVEEQSDESENILGDSLEDEEILYDETISNDENIEVKEKIQKSITIMIKMFQKLKILHPQKL